MKTTLSGVVGGDVIGFRYRSKSGTPARSFLEALARGDPLQVPFKLEPAGLGNPVHE